MCIYRLVSVRLGVLASVAVIVGLLGASSASAAIPALSVDTVRTPKNLPPGGSAVLVLDVINLGDAPAEGGTTPIVIEDKLPSGLEATAATGPGCVVSDPQDVRCEYSGPIPSYADEELIEVTVNVAANASATVSNEVSVGGGGAITRTVREDLPVSSRPAGDGVEKVELAATNEDGSLDTQAGSHPFQVTGTIDMDTFGMRNVHMDLPAGLIGNTNVVPQCTDEEFGAIVEHIWNSCPEGTAIGAATPHFLNFSQGFEAADPIFNLVPAPGEPARFGFRYHGVPIILDTAVRTGGDYGVIISSSNVAQELGVTAVRVTLWGDPADPRHDSTRGWSCLTESLYGAEYLEGAQPCVRPGAKSTTPFLTLPTSCTGATGMRTTVFTESWLEPGIEKGEAISRNSLGEPAGLSGCNRLPFKPSITVAPDGQAASTPTGLTVGVHVPQEGALNPTGLSPADVKDTTVALPAGVQVSPAGADGLLACSLEQIGLETPASPTCPDAAKVGSVEIKTPLLPEPLEGAVYLAAQNANPFGSLLALYIVAEDPKAGIVIKFAGKVTLDPVTGQLVSTFEDTPELPFEDLKLSFFGSDRAPLTTPSSCGHYATTASITPSSGNAPVQSESTFQITTGPDGTSCASPRPFAPGFQAGSLNLQAGAFTPFTLTMTRPDQDQTLSKVDVTLPPGLTGTLKGVKLCPEAQANAGTCTDESLIGHTIVSAGLGGDPYTVPAGRIYLTEHYGGGEFGLSIVNPAKAGPFVLQEGRPVIVRAAVFVDPHTTALRIVSDPLPTIIDGIPLQIQHVNVTIDRDKFQFNPTNCSKMSINATLGSSEGASSGASTPFQVTNCANLAFNPKFAVSIPGHASRANGEALTVKLTYPSGPQDANIAKVKVQLPKQLPSRLSTLQKACLAKVFNANPADCPPASIVGHAKALTPILPVPLEGNAYFVSHGGEAFPDLTIVLKGYGVTLDLVGSTFISNSGITTSTFKTVPDAPVGSFELTLPMGRYSALGANLPHTGYDFCSRHLVMPTEFIAQNGAEIHQNTPIAITGCPKAKKAHKAKKAGRSRSHTSGNRHKA
jgi:hypothetical protein